jgi:hypothetical protein
MSSCKRAVQYQTEFSGKQIGGDTVGDGYHQEQSIRSSGRKISMVPLTIVNKLIKSLLHGPERPHFGAIHLGALP